MPTPNFGSSTRENIPSSNHLRTSRMSSTRWKFVPEASGKIGEANRANQLRISRCPFSEAKFAPPVSGNIFRFDKPFKK